MMKENLLRINYDSDFEILDKIPHIGVPFNYKYFVGDDFEHIKEITYDGNTYVGCTPIDGDDSHIIVYFDGLSFPCGNLRVRREFLMDNSSFEDNIENLVVVNHTNIYITKCDGLSWASVYIDSQLPNFDVYAITSKVEQSLTDINAKLADVNDALENMRQLSDLAQDIIQTLSGYEQDFSEITQWINDFAESDPVFNASVAATITQEDIDRWNNGTFEGELPENIVTADDLANYVTREGLTLALKSYVFKTDLDDYYTKSESIVMVTNAIRNLVSNDALSDYFTKAETLELLNSYVTKNYLNQQLANNINEGNISQWLLPYASKNDVNIKLNDYYSKDEIGTLVSNFVTKNNLRDMLEAYVSSTSLQSILQQYATKNNLYSYAEKQWVEDKNYATQNWVLEKIINSNQEIDLSDYVTYAGLRNMDYLTVRDLVQGEYIQVELDGYIQASEIQSKIINAYHLVTGDNVDNYIDLSAYAKIIDMQNWVKAQNYLKTETDPLFVASAASRITNTMIDRWNNAAAMEPINLAAYALKKDIPSLDGYAKITDIPSLASYVKKTELPDFTKFAMLTDIPSVSDFVKKSEMPNMALYALKTDIPNIAGLVKSTDLVNYVTWDGLRTELDDYATKEYVLLALQNQIGAAISNINLTDYATKAYVSDVVANAIKATRVDLTPYALKSDIPSMSNYYNKSEVDDKIAVISAKVPSLNNYYTKTESDARFALKSDTYTKTEVNALVNSGTGSGSATYESPFVLLSQQQYDNLSSYDNKKMYIITDAVQNQTYSKSEIDTKLGDIDHILQNILNG